ncbi:uncharacterized protein LOC113547825 [Rhopalosiphum maidis]|uniref:uncharacterized protein LOC113547825 n=1 Tax=Rhopalosiphum maidis TaxID=43146 RepID=UPI000EFEFE28|nr:uncharacterized protein LOC113547825 [Rhopalosiphum maidis]
MIEQTALHNILTWVIAVILFIFQSLNYFIAWIKNYVGHGQKKTTVVTTDTTTLSELNPNNNNAPKNVIAVQGLIQKHFDIPLIIAEDEPKVNDFIKNAQLLISNENCKEKQKIDQFMEHFVDDSYVARGLGLITANVGRESEFYLYSKYDNNFENVVIRLKGRHGESGQITISSQDPTNLIDTKLIPMDYFYDEDRIKVTYTPFAEGVYTLTLVRNGLSICRSPYYISVEKSPTNSRSQIRLGTKKYKMVSKFAKAKHVPLETCDSNIPVIEPRKPSISRNVLPASVENSIRTDVMSIVTKFESNSINFQKKINKRTSNISKTSPKTDLINEISTNSNIQPKIVTVNDHDTNVNDLNSPIINSIPKSTEEKFWSNLDISNINSKKNDINSIDAKSNRIKKSIIKLDKSTRNTSDIPRVKNVSLNHLGPTNSALLKESLNHENSHDVEKQNKTYNTNELIYGQNQIETFLDPITIIDKSEIKCIDNELCTQNEVSCFDDDNEKTVVVMENINELESHPKDSAIQKISDSAQYNIYTPLASIITKITNCVCEKCSIQVLKILSEIPRDINLTYKNNSNEICSSFETLLAQPISININIDNLFENSIKPTNEQKSDNLLSKSPTNMKLMDTINKDVKYHYLNEITPTDNTSNEIYCDINNTTKELIIKKNKHDGEINKTKNDKITNNNFVIPFTEHDIDKHKTIQLENKLSTNEIIKNEYSITNEANVLNCHQLNNATIYKLDDKMQMQIQDEQISLEYNMDLIETHKFHEYNNKELKKINKENNKTLDKSDLVTTSYEIKINTEPVKEEFKIKNDIIAEKNTNSQSFPINSTVLASIEGELPTLRYKSEDNRQNISNISNINFIINENQKLIIENSIEPVLNNFKNKIVEKITQLYLNKNLSNTENTSINENHDIQETFNLQETKLRNNDENKEIKTKCIEKLKSQLKNHIDKNEISKIILDKTKKDNNHLFKYVKNIIKTNMHPSEMQSEKLTKNNPQTLVNIAKKHINNQQINNDFKRMITENETKNVEVKKNNNEEIVQDTEIMLTKTPSDIKIETMTETIKSNISEKTEVIQNIDDKNKIETIKLQINDNELRKIHNTIEKEIIYGKVENNNMGTTINSTKNTATNQLKKKDSEFQETKKMTEAIHIEVEKENNNKLSQINRIKDIMIENPNLENKVSKLNENMVKVIEEKEISSESTSYNNAKKLSIKRPNTGKTEKEDETLGNTKEKGKILSNYQLANDLSNTVTKDFKKEKDTSHNSLNTKYKLTTLESTVNEINCKIGKKYEDKDKANEHLEKNDATHETEIMSDKIINRPEIDNSSLIKSSITPILKKIVVEFVTKKNTTIDSLAIIVHEQSEQNDENTNDTKTKTNTWKFVKEKEEINKKKNTRSKPCTNTSNVKVEKLDGENLKEENNLNGEIKPNITNTNNIIENETDQPIRISTTFQKAKIEKEKIIINPSTPVTSAVESKIEEDINGSDLIACTETSNLQVVEATAVGEVIEENTTYSGTKTEKATNYDINQMDTSLPTDTSSTSEEVTIEKEEIVKTPLQIESPVTSTVESKTEEDINGSDLIACTETSNVQVVEATAVGEVIEETTTYSGTETEKATNYDINQMDTILPTDTSSTSEEVTIEKEGIVKTPIQIESPVTSTVESKTEEDINGSDLIACTEPSNLQVVEATAVGEIIEENNDTSLPTDTSSTSGEVTIEKEEIIKTPLQTETPVTSTVESKTEEDINGSDLIACTETSNLQVVEATAVGEVIEENTSNIGTEMENATNYDINDTDTSLPTDTSSTSEEVTIEKEEIVKTPLQIESPVTSTVESKTEEDINGSDLIGCTETSNLQVVEATAVGEVIEENTSNIGTEMENATNYDINDTDTSLPTDTSSTSEEVTIEKEEIVKTPLQIESPVTSTVESKIEEDINGSDLIACTETSNIHIEEATAVGEVIEENISNIGTETEKATNYDISETDTSLPTDTSSTSGEVTIEKEEIIKTPLQTETPVTSTVESKTEEDINGSDLIGCTETSYLQVVEATAVGEVIEENTSNIGTEIENATNYDISETDTSLPTDTSSTSEEVTIEKEEIVKTPLQIESPVTSTVESKIEEDINGSDLIACTETSNIHIEEATAVGEVIEENISNIGTETEKATNYDISETDTSLPTDTSSTSEEVTIEKEEIVKTPLQFESPVTSEAEPKTEEDINESDLIGCTETSNLQVVEETGVREVIEENISNTGTETEKATNYDINQMDTSLPTDTSSTSEEVTIEKEEIVKTPLQIESPVTSTVESIEKEEIIKTPLQTETPVTSTVESKTEEDINGSDLIGCTETSYLQVVEATAVGEVIEENTSNIGTEIENATNYDISETDTSLPTDTSSTSEEVTIEKEEIVKTPLQIESPVTSTVESKIEEDINGSDLIACTETSNIHIEEATAVGEVIEENISNIGTETEKATNYDISETDTSLPTDTSSTSEEVTIEKEEIVKTPLQFESPVTSEAEPKTEEDINESDLIGCTETSNLQVVEETGVREVIEENISNTGTETEKATNYDINQMDTSLPTDTSSTSEEVTIEKEEIVKTPLQIESPVTSTVESKTEEDINGSDLIACTETSNLKVVEATAVGEIIEENTTNFGTETENATNYDINETDTSLPTDTSSTSGEVTIEKEEIIKTPLQTETPVTSTVESKTEEDINGSDLIGCTETSNLQVVEATAVGEVIEENTSNIGTEMENATNYDINDTDTSLPTDTSSTSEEVTIEKEEIVKTPLQIESPVTSTVESKIEEDINGSDLIACTETSNIHIEEATAVGEVIEENISNMEQRRKKLQTTILTENATNYDINETDTSLPTDTSSTSGEVTIEKEEIIKTPLQTETPVTSTVESKTEEDINGSDLIACTETSNLQVVEATAVGEVIEENTSNIGTEMENATNYDINDTDTSLPTDTSSTSGEVTIEKEEIIKTPLQTETPVTSTVESKTEEDINGSDLISCTETSYLQVVEATAVGEVIEENTSNIGTEIENATNYDISDTDTSLPPDTSSTSGEVTIEKEEIVKTPLQFESPVTSKAEPKKEEDINESDLIGCTETSNLQVVEETGVREVIEENISNTGTETEKTTNYDINQMDTSLPTDTSSTSEEVTIEKEEIVKTPLQIESPVTSTVESKTEEDINGRDLIACTETSNLKVVEATAVGEIIEENTTNIGTETENATNYDINETDTSLPTDTSSTSGEVTIEKEEIIKTPLQTETPVTSTVESKIEEDINGSDLIACTETSNVQVVEATAVGEVIEETTTYSGTETEKATNYDINQMDTILPTDTSSTSEEVTIEKEEIVKTPLQIESPVTSTVESKTEEDINGSDLIACTETSNIHIEEATAVGEVIEENISNIGTETEKATNYDINETDTSLPTDTSSTSEEVTIEKEEIVKTPLQIESPVTSTVESKIEEDINGSDLIACTETSNIHIEEATAVGEVIEENISNIGTETEKATNYDINETDTSLPTDTSSTSEEVTIEKEEIVKTPLQIESPVTSTVESKIEEDINGSDLIACTETSNIHIEEATAVGEVIEENISNIGTETEKATNYDISETDTSLPTDTSSTSEEVTIEKEEIVKTPLQFESPVTSEAEPKTEEDINESDLIGCTETSNLQVVEETGVREVIEENISNTGTETEKATNYDINQMDTSLPTDTSSTSEEVTIEKEEIVKTPLQIESPVTSTVESKTEEDINGSDLIACTETSNLKVVEATAVGEIIEENTTNIGTETENATNYDINETDTSLPTDTSSTSGEVTIEKEEIIKTPLQTETPVTSTVESKTEEDINGSDLIACTETSNLKVVEATAVGEVIEETTSNIGTETEKATNYDINETDTSLPTDTSSTSGEVTIEKEEIIKTPLQTETPVTSTVESKIEEDINGSDLIACTETSNVQVVEATAVGEIIEENTTYIGTETEKAANYDINETETILPTHTSATSEEVTIEKEEIIKTPLQIESSVTSTVESKTEEDINGSDLIACTETSNVIKVEPRVVGELIEEDMSNYPISSIMMVKLIINNDKESETSLPIVTPSTFVDDMNKIEERIETLDTSVEQSTLLKEEQLNVADILQSKHISHIHSSKIFLKNQSILDFEIEKKSLFPNDAFSESVEKHDLDEVGRQTLRVNVKEIKNTILIDTPTTFVEDQKLEDRVTVIENILAIDTSTASVQEQIQIEEVIKDESMPLINSSVSFDDEIAVEQNEIKTTAMVSSITSMEEQIIVNADDVMDTFTESLDKTSVEKRTHNEMSTLTDILVAVVDEQIDLKKVTNNETQILVDTSTAFLENPIKIEKCTEKESTALFTSASTSKVELNEIDVKSDNKTSTPVNLASVAIEQTETDTEIEITSPNVNVINSSSETILIDKEIKTENSDNHKNCYLKFGESSKFHCLKNEEIPQGKSYSIQKLEMSVQRLKTSNDDYYEKTFVQLEQTEKISIVDKDKVDCENKNNIDDKLYTVNESDLNAILCASSLEEALTLLDSKIKFKFKHRKSSSKANSATSYIPKIQTSESRSSGINTNFTDARDFFKEIEKKSKK